MVDKSAYEQYFSNDTRTLMEGYVQRFKDAHTRGAYMHVFSCFAAHVRKDWFKCGAADFKSFVDAQFERFQADELSYSTYAKYYKIIAAFSRYCYKISRDEVPSPFVPSDYEDYSTAARVKSPSDRFRPQNIPALSDVEKVLAYTRAADKLTYFAILFSIGSFLKTNEFLNIASRDLMQDAAGAWCVRLSDGYMVLLDGDFGKELAEYVSAALSPADLIFSRHTKSGTKPITERGLRKRLLKACEQVGAQAFTFNELRNTAAVYTASAGATKEEIATSMRYKTTAHIDRLESLKLPQRNDASRFIHFTLSDSEDKTV